MCPKQDKNLETKKAKTIISVRTAVLVQGSGEAQGPMTSGGSVCGVGGKSHGARRIETRVRREN